MNCEINCRLLSHLWFKHSNILHSLVLVHQHRDKAEYRTQSTEARRSKIEVSQYIIVDLIWFDLLCSWKGCDVLRPAGLYVCLSVCSLARIRNHKSKLHQIFYTSYLWPWLGPALTTVQYIIYLRFSGSRHDFTQWPPYGQNQ